jgi:hypothetical protein
VAHFHYVPELKNILHAIETLLKALANENKVFLDKSSRHQDPPFVALYCNVYSHTSLLKTAFSLPEPGHFFIAASAPVIHNCASECFCPVFT